MELRAGWRILKGKEAEEEGKSNNPERTLLELREMKLGQEMQKGAVFFFLTKWCPVGLCYTYMWRQLTVGFFFMK